MVFLEPDGVLRAHIGRPTIGLGKTLLLELPDTCWGPLPQLHRPFPRSWAPQQGRVSLIILRRRDVP